MVLVRAIAECTPFSLLAPLCSSLLSVLQVRSAEMMEMRMYGSLKAYMFIFGMSRALWISTMRSPIPPATAIAGGKAGRSDKCVNFIGDGVRGLCQSSVMRGLGVSNRSK